MQRKKEEPTDIIDGYDILGRYKTESFVDWKHFYRKYYAKPSYPAHYVNGKDRFEHIWIAFYIIKRMIQLIIHDVLYENQGFIFTKKDGEPYFWLAVRDNKKNRRYKYKAKFRGHYYGFWQYMFPRFRKLMRGRTVKFDFYKFKNKGDAYAILSRLVQAGKDYDEAPILLTDAEVKYMRKMEREKQAEKERMTQSAENE